MAHGTSDGVVRYQYGKHSMDVLKPHFSKLQWNTYQGMEHSSCDEEIRDLNAFLAETLKP
jgi:predicted esterase